MIFGASFSPTIIARASIGEEARSPKPNMAFSTKSAPCLMASLAVRRRNLRTFWTLTGSVTETANAVWPSTSSRKRTRLAQGSSVKSTLPFLKTNSRAALFFATPARGQTRSTDPRFRLLSKPFSGTPVISQETNRTSTNRFVFVAITDLYLAPLMNKTAPTVRKRIQMSIHGDQFRTYRTSRATRRA